MSSDLGYLAKPTEFEVRLRQLKKDIKEQGIHDYFESPISAENILALDAVKLKNEGMDLFKNMKEEYRALKNSGASQAELDKVKNKYFSDIEALEKDVGKINTSGDTQDLLDRWSPEFFSKNGTKNPSHTSCCRSSWSFRYYGKPIRI